jgi:hypothetical protein
MSPEGPNWAPEATFVVGTPPQQLVKYLSTPTAGFPPSGQKVSLSSLIFRFTRARPC